MATVTIPKQETPPNSEELIALYLKNIETWEKRVQSLVQEKEQEKPPTLEEELAELKQLSEFLKGRLTKRMVAIKKYPEELRQKYLRCLEPFYTEEGITRFMGHYFDVEVFKQVRLRYRKKKDFEKEVAILFDLYKVKKTIETIVTLEKSVDSDDPFPSQFPKSEQAEFLKTLKEIFKLFFLRFVKKEHRKMLFQSLSESKLEMDSIIEMRKSGTSYIIPEVIQSNEYREKFITVFFSTLLRTKTSGDIKDLHFNYLNFELLKNEFLTHWMQSKLKNSPEKDKVLQTYKIGEKSIAQLIKENPEKEAEILASVPLEVFNDMAEQVNEKVKPEDKTPVNTLSENHGIFARIQSSFTQVKQIAKLSVEKMEEMKPKSKIWTVKKKAGAAQKTPKPGAKTKQKPEQETKKDPGQKPKEKPKQETVQELKIDYGLQVLTMDELDFPFFDRRYETYKAKIDYFKKKVGTDYEQIRGSIWKLFNSVDREHFIIRKEPCHEWALPLVFTHEKNRYLLIVGAEISLKDQQAGYKSRYKKSQHQLNCYYAFATETEDKTFGKVVDQRKVRNVPFSQYSLVEKTIHSRAAKFLAKVLQSQDKKVFKNSNLKLRKPDEPFAELEELRALLGLDEKEKQAQSKKSEPAQPSKAPDAAKPGTQANKEKPATQDVNQAATQPNKDVEKEQANPEPQEEKPKHAQQEPKPQTKEPPQQVKGNSQANGDSDDKQQQASADSA